jgi:hypothetical protein
MKPTIFLAAVAAGVICGYSLAETPAAASGPWANVPALPTKCYSGDDPWWDQHKAALEAIHQAHYAQNDINSEIRQRETDAMSADPMAMAQRMQEAMMKDPANAQKYMEQMMQQGQEAPAKAAAQSEKEKQLDAEAKTVMQQYKAALAAAAAPAEARWTALKKKMGIPMDSRSPGEMGVPDWAWAEWDVIQRERDQAYAANCAQWWTATGPIHTYMKRYKDYLVGERIPYEKEMIDGPRLRQYETLNVSTDGWRTTTDYEAAEDYLGRAYTLFGERASHPNCPRGKCGW